MQADRTLIAMLLLLLLLTACGVEQSAKENESRGDEEIIENSTEERQENRKEAMKRNGDAESAETGKSPPAEEERSEKPARSPSEVAEEVARLWTESDWEGLYRLLPRAERERLS